MASATVTRKSEAAYLNRIIDDALLNPSNSNRQALLELCDCQTTTRLAERVRRRATLLLRRQATSRARLLQTRDTLMLAIYHNVVPRGWFTAWCNGSSTEIEYLRHAGVGAMLMNPQGEIIDAIAQSVGELDPFEAEIAALAIIITSITRTPIV